MDCNGYPEDDDIACLKEQLFEMDFHKSAAAIQSLIDLTGYGRATIGVNPGRLEVATGGWSGCEEIVQAIHGTIWRMAYWESSHRGGLEVFSENATGGIK